MACSRQLTLNFRIARNSFSIPDDPLLGPSMANLNSRPLAGGGSMPSPTKRKKPPCGYRCASAIVRKHKVEDSV